VTRISFIVPTFNRAHFIAASLESITSQMDDADEIIVIDDGSTDATESVVRAADPRIRYVRQDNAGKSVALNRAMQMTDGNFVWICDDDDLLRRGAVPLLSDQLTSSGADFVFGRYSRFREDEQGRAIDMGTGYWPDLSQGTILRHVMEDAFIMQNAALVRRSLYARVGPFNETMLRSLDYEMFVRLAMASPGHYVDALIFDQRKHDGPRGPARALHAAADSDRVWLEFDRRIFAETAGPFELELFHRMFDAEAPMLLQRVSLLQRACINARHDLWPAAIDDLELASRLCPEKDLTAVERAICLRVLSGKHGFAAALEPNNAERLVSLLHSNRPAARLMRAVLAGVFWRFRWGDKHDRQQARALLWRVAGVLESSSTIGAHFAKRRGVDNFVCERKLSRTAPYQLQPYLVFQAG
jgi:hypothetical protein